METVKPNLAALVLAGGVSSRMGQDKALIAIAGVPLLRRVCEAALECTAEVHVITPWTQRYETIVPAACGLIPESGRAGPLVGFAHGLSHIHTEWVLLLACDLPGIEGTLLQNWLAELADTGEAIALLPKSAKGWEPLCGFYRVSCLPRLQAAIARGERSFQGWLAQEVVKQLPPQTTRMLFNCNTPQELNWFLSNGSAES